MTRISSAGRRFAPCALVGALLLGQSAKPGAAQMPRGAEPAVAQANAAIRQQLSLSDRQDFEDATRGRIADVPGLVVKGPGGRDTWNLRDYAFLQAAEAPATVNPSLWRQAQLNAIAGLFKVADGLYQVRGFDIANMTIVEGQRGIIVIDPLLAVESARAALDLYLAHRPRKPVVAVIYTHSHLDHYAGVAGVLNDADVAARRVRVIAPAGFMEAAVSENIIAGNAMQRRGNYQFGPLLPRSERGHVDSGLGKGVARGTRSLIAPTEVIVRPLDRRTIDGVPIVFQLAPSSEAPAEMHLYFPRVKVLDIAENATHTLHNLLPLRGAEVRDARAWSHHLDDALQQFGAEADVMIAQHHWPTWGNARVRALLAGQRDLYAYLHDQTVRLMNQGHTPDEIADELALPPSLAREWWARQYYGTISHDVKAIYQKYLGWYDGNPAHLDPLPPQQAARKYVEYMGGAPAVIQHAREDFDRGNYRWVADVMNRVVFAEPDNREARELAASAFEQLGYLAESATWRDAYLQAASELRGRSPRVPGPPVLTSAIAKALPLSMVFDYLAVHLNGPRAGGRRIVLNWSFPDARERLVSTLQHGALTYRLGTHASDADATITLRRATLDSLVLQPGSFPALIDGGQVEVAGDTARLKEFLRLFDQFDPAFPVVEPRTAMERP